MERPQVKCNWYNHIQSEPGIVQSEPAKCNWYNHIQSEPGIEHVFTHVTFHTRFSSWDHWGEAALGLKILYGFQQPLAPHKDGYQAGSEM